MWSLWGWSSFLSETVTSGAPCLVGSVLCGARQSTPLAVCGRDLPLPGWGTVSALGPGYQGAAVLSEYVPVPVRTPSDIFREAGRRCGAVMTPSLSPPPPPPTHVFSQPADQNACWSILILTAESNRESGFTSRRWPPSSRGPPYPLR